MVSRRVGGDAALRSEALRCGIWEPALAAALVAEGDTNAAMAWIEVAYRQRNPALVGLKVEPRYTALRRDRRFQDLLRRMGLAR